MKTSENYFRELPEGYSAVKVIDAKDKKTVRRINILSILIVIAGIVPFLIGFDRQRFMDSFSIVYYVGFLLGFVVYIVLHELVHGLFYKIFTHQKLTFGMTLSVAFCGVPELYVTRTVALVTTLAPFVVFDIVYIVALVLVKNYCLHFLVSILFSCHVGGCIGDLWGSFFMLTKYRDKPMLLNDTGPKQSFYVLDPSLKPDTPIEIQSIV